ncbi:PIN domain-containing protein [Candidatus Woesearchaeota archaeon]|nr:PIN domain-containing protein [Candidatus Woesearchaeota archaeon]
MHYFFDSYALIEMLCENPSFEKYKSEDAIITLLNLIETTQYFMEHFGEERASIVCKNLSLYVVELSSEDILNATKFRAENKKKSLSYADCIGYVYARNHKLVFLTGDDAFKNLQNVEFVK